LFAGLAGRRNYVKRCSIATVFSLQAQISLKFATDPSLFGEFSGGSATTSLRSVLCDEGKLAEKNRWALWPRPNDSFLEASLDHELTGRSSLLKSAPFRRGIGNFAPREFIDQTHLREHDHGYQKEGRQEGCQENHRQEESDCQEGCF